MGTCYANNPASPYVTAIVKSWKHEFVDPATVNAWGKTRPGYSTSYRLDPREAIVVYGKMPPPARYMGRYMGLESYVFTKEWLTDDQPWDPSAHAEIQAIAPQLYQYLFNLVPGDPSRVQSFSSLSNSINNVVIRRQAGSVWNKNRYFIITPDRAMKHAVLRSLRHVGVQKKKVFTEPIPPSHPLGLGRKADDFMTGIRYRCRTTRTPAAPGSTTCRSRSFGCASARPPTARRSRFRRSSPTSGPRRRRSATRATSTTSPGRCASGGDSRATPTTPTPTS